MHYHDLAWLLNVAHTHNICRVCSSLGQPVAICGSAMAPDVEVTRHLQGDGVNRQLLLAWKITMFDR